MKQQKYYSCFISYSRQDKDFARWLYDSLSAAGIQCWLDEKMIAAGDKIVNEIDKGIKHRDKVLLCCSENSLNSWWVNDEISKTFDKEEKLWKERNQEILVLIPLNLDGFLFKWDGAVANRLKDRLAPDFEGWQNGLERFQKEVDGIIKALEIGKRVGNISATKFS
jgi:hypothetical protein